MAAEDFTQRASTYEKESGWILSPDFIKPLVPAVFGGGKMLDVCTGTGIVAEYASDIGWTATALDANEEMLKDVRLPVTPVLADANHLPFADNSFDLVVCRQGLQYLDMAQAAREMLRVCSGQVRLLHGFVREQNIPSWKRLFAISGRNSRNFFSEKILASAIESACPSKVEETFLVSRERFVKPPLYRAAIDQFLETNPEFAAGQNVDNQADAFYYDLNWVIHTVTK